MDEKTIYIILFFTLIRIAPTTAQVNDAQYQIETLMEAASENFEEGNDASSVLNDLEDLLHNKLNINTASDQELSKLHLLNDLQIEKLILHREKYGQYYSLYDMNAVESLNPEVLKKMEPFISFGPTKEKSFNFREIFQYQKHELLLRTQGIVQEQAGYKPGKDGTIPFEGDMLRHYTRYKFTSGRNISAGFTAEKDPGEAFFSGTNKYGYDFYSAYLSIQPNLVIQNVTIGDYVVRGGQGLILWQGFSFGKSTNALSVSKLNQGIRPYTSADENKFFRGATTTLKIKKAMISIFISNKDLDGNKAGVDSIGHWITSLQSTGYHRTVNETEDKRSVNDFNAGALVNWHMHNLRLGAVVLYRQFEFPLLPADQPYNKFNFRGTINKTAGINYLFGKGKLQLSGEAAISASSGKAVVQGMELYLHDRIQVSTLFRHFNNNYHALWASPFCENSSAANETGFYIGTRILPARHFTITAYSDYYQSKWTKYTTTGPSQGSDVFIQTTFTPTPQFQVYLRIKNEVKDKKHVLNERYVNHPEGTTKTRLHCQSQPYEWLILRSRIEHIAYKGVEKEYGILLLQDTQFTPEKLPVNMTFRLAWFKTDSYNSRIYAYENDLLNVFSIPAYYGEGLRTYLNLKYRINPKIEIWFKLANLTQNGVDTMGSGYNKIKGNQKTELKFQMRFKL